LHRKPDLSDNQDNEKYESNVQEKVDFNSHLLMITQKSRKKMTTKILLKKSNQQETFQERK